jgi:hypothetical protein
MNESVQKGAAADGFGIVLWIPGADSIVDVTAPTVAELTAATAVRLTYGLTSDGFNHTAEVAKVTSSRYTLRQALTYDGIITDTVTLTYVYNRTTPTPAEEILSVEGTDGFLVHMLGYPNDHVIAAGDKINAVIPVTTSISTDVPPAQNTELMKTQVPNVRGEVGREVAVVAGP